MQTFPRSGLLTLAPGANLRVDISGNFFRVLEASGVLDVAFDDEDMSSQVEPGLAVYRDKSFSGFRLTNIGAVAVTGVLVAVGYGRFEDNRLKYTGGVAIRGGGAGFSDGAVSVGNAAVQVLAADAGRTSAVIRAGSADLWLGPSNAVAALGPATIPAGASLTIGHTAAIWAIRAGGAVEAGIYEEFA